MSSSVDAKARAWRRRAWSDCRSGCAWLIEWLAANRNGSGAGAAAVGTRLYWRYPLQNRLVMKGVKFMMLLKSILSPDSRVT